jgi:hypothetical protein
LGCWHCCPFSGCWFRYAIAHRQSHTRTESEPGVAVAENERKPHARQGRGAC